MVSPEEREDLVQRVARRLVRGTVRDEVIREAVDRTLGALARDARASALLDGGESVSGAAVALDEAGTGEGVAVLAANSTPDLASRVRRALRESGVDPRELATATEGRHTVVALRLPIAAAAKVQAAADALGVRFSWRGEVP